MYRCQVQKFYALEKATDAAFDAINACVEQNERAVEAVNTYEHAKAALENQKRLLFQLKCIRVSRWQAV